MSQLPLSRYAAAIVAAGLLSTTIPALAQQVQLPRTSQKASVSQTIGITEVTLTYSRPGVKGREIWGGLVPYGKVWRTGANENTSIAFSDAVKVDGHELAAGTYGLHTIPGEQEWTVIFNNVSNAWGSYTYDAAKDALRIQVVPHEAPFREWMGFDFDKLTSTSAEVVLRWEKLAVPFTVEADTPANVVAEVNGAVGWQPLVQAAGYCLGNGCEADAARWVDAAIALEPNFWTYRAQAQLKARQEDYAGAVAAGEKALAAVSGMKQAPAQGAVSGLESSIEEWKGKK